MNMEEQTAERATASHYDAHEFDGLRDDLDSEVEGILGQIDGYIRANPWVTLAVAGAVGIAVGRALRR